MNLVVAHGFAPADRSGRLSFERLCWLGGCSGAALLADFATLPHWVLLLSVAVIGARLLLAWHGRDAAPRGLRFIVAALAIGLLFLQFRTFNGLTAGTALLCLIAGLKFFETRTQRDVQVVCMIVYFLCLAALLDSESFWLFSYLVCVGGLTTVTLLGVSRSNLRYCGRMLAQALPLTLAFWLFFPRFNGPLWQMPSDARNAPSGLTDSMSPGDITDLAQSDEVAFRVRFHGATPPPEARYWRGPVLDEFDGRAWRRGGSSAGHTAVVVGAPPLVYEGSAYRYTVSLEPNEHDWLFVLDWPSQWDLPHTFMSSDYMLLQPYPISQPLDLTATSYSVVHAAGPLGVLLRRRTTALPPGRNPQSLALARRLWADHPTAPDYVQAVLAMFHDQPFYYTLSPPALLGANAVDDFLFSSKRGFCAHYASAFAVLMRAVGIPARVITGYQGGTYNRFADYWIVQQSNAHAWDEIWIDGEGWRRVDPTAVIPPQRAQQAWNGATTTGSPVIGRWQQHTPWLSDVRLRMDALRLLWRERILSFDENSQERLLGLLHVPAPDGQKLALVLAVCLAILMSWLTWQVRRERGARPVDPASRTYARLCRRLAVIGLARHPAEGAEAYAARIAAARPDLGATVSTLCRQYSDLRYAGDAGTDTTAAALHAFAAAVRGFKPRDSRAYSEK